MKHTQTSVICKACSNPRRLQLLVELKKHKHASVGYLVDTTTISFQAVSQHLRDLERAGIITNTQDGQFRLYRIANNLHPIAKYIVGTL